MVSVFDYLDYRDFLQDYYNDRKKNDAYFSYRFMGARVHLHASHLIRILQKQRHITLKSIPGFAGLCKMSLREREYFEALVNFNKAKSETQAKSAFERLLSLSSLDKRQLRADQYELFQHWYYGAIQVLFSFVPFKDDYAALAKRLSPPISVHQAKKAVALLERLDLIRRNCNGYFELSDQFVTTGDKWKSLAARVFQHETIRLADESLDRHAKELRDISTVTIGITKKDLPLLRETIAEFRQSLLRIAKDGDAPDDVYQFNVQLFPLTLADDSSEPHQKDMES